MGILQNYYYNKCSPHLISAATLPCKITCLLITILLHHNIITDKVQKIDLGNISVQLFVLSETSIVVAVSTTMKSTVVLKMSITGLHAHCDYVNRRKAAAAAAVALTSTVALE